ncbi:O-antigen polymerase [Larkinella knui]|uniref:O-antigen polysaccharide polymerase Wzy n=1 Tax=Larkinella knui TaxID=2025310 RepID=A0A3P1CL50_9BACT|nr:O-antigen polymerase [Larkinella knui]RRB14061.1 O-antigen polysaccharide polymerase Wzy [Larkinella knui]
MIWLYIGINLITLIYAFMYVRRIGTRQVIPFVICLALLAIYCLFTPTYFYLVGRETSMGDDGLYQFTGKRISDYYKEGMFFYMIANMLFVFGFTWKQYKGSKISYSIQSDSIPYIQKKVLWLYILFFGIVCTDIFISGINPFNILLGSSDENLFGHQSITNSYYFRNCADCIITTIILFAYLKGNKYKIILMTLSAFALFAIMGFRYRIILTIIGLVLIYSLDEKYKLSTSTVSFTSLLLIYFIFFITYNRWNFIHGRFSELSYNPVEFEYEMFFEQTRASLADFNLIRYYDENPTIKHDYGLTMFGYIFIKALPKFVFPNGEKPYPPPALVILDNSLELPRQWDKPGEAAMHYGSFYIAFGWIGLVIMPFLMGIWVRYVVGRNPSSNPLGFLKQIVFALALFQFITRGYFPQFVDHFVYISLPIWLLSGLIKKSTVLQPHHELTH